MTWMDRIHAKCWLAYISNIVRHCNYCLCVRVLMHGVGWIVFLYDAKILQQSNYPQTHLKTLSSYQTFLFPLFHIN